MSLEKRQQIIDLKQQKFSLKYIALVTGINKKTIQSVVQLNRKKMYSDFENQVINDYLDTVLNQEIMKKLNKKQQKSFIKNLIEKEFDFETSHYQQYLLDKKQSQRKRILNQVALEIQFRFLQHQNIKFATQIVNDESEIHLTVQESAQLFEEWFI